MTGEQLYKKIISRFPELGIKVVEEYSDEMKEFVNSFQTDLINKMNSHVKD